jgi:hypothetical protein
MEDNIDIRSAIEKIVKYKAKLLNLQTEGISTQKLMRGMNIDISYSPACLSEFINHGFRIKKKQGTKHYHDFMLKIFNNYWLGTHDVDGEILNELLIYVSKNDNPLTSFKLHLPAARAVSLMIKTDENERAEILSNDYCKEYPKYSTSKFVDRYLSEIIESIKLWIKDDPNNFVLSFQNSNWLRGIFSRNAPYDKPFIRNNFIPVVDLIKSKLNHKNINDWGNMGVGCIYDTAKFLSINYNKNKLLVFIEDKLIKKKYDFLNRSIESAARYLSDHENINLKTIDVINKTVKEIDDGYFKDLEEFKRLIVLRLERMICLLPGYYQKAFAEFLRKDEIKKYL